MSQQGDIRSDDELDQATEYENQEPAAVENDHVVSDGEESSSSSSEGGMMDQRMHMSSLPGVRAPASDSEESSPKRWEAAAQHHRVGKYDDSTAVSQGPRRRRRQRSSRDVSES